MSRLQIRLFGPEFSSFLAHSYGYETANESKSGINPPNFHFDPLSPTGTLVVTIRTIKKTMVRSLN
jgi:hypothetical protein